MTDIYKKIKKQNGEAFAKAIRNHYNGIFEIGGIVDMLEYAGRKAEEPLMKYLVSLQKTPIQAQEVSEDPIALLDKAGYDAYVVTALTDEDNPDYDPNNPKTWRGQNTIKRYYASDEELCTFREPTRYQRYYIINAVKKDVDEIKRGYPPKREDDYGTSVISIQVFKMGGFISIKNRYNHTVENPDYTFGSNPDQIILGLSDAIRNRFGVDFSSQNVSLPKGFIRIRDQEGKDRIIHYHREERGYYIGPKCYVKDGVLSKVNPDSEILLENFVLHLNDGTVKNVSGANSALHELLENTINGKRIHIRKEDDVRHLLLPDGQEVLTVKDGRLLSMNILGGVKKIRRWTFGDCSYLKSINILDNDTEIEEEAFERSPFGFRSILTPDNRWEIVKGVFSHSLESIDIPEGVRKIGKDAFKGCNNLTITCCNEKQEEMLQEMLQRNELLKGNIVTPQDTSNPVSPTLVAEQRNSGDSPQSSCLKEKTKEI